MDEKKICRPVIMVIDIGGSKYMPGFVDGEGKILYQERREWEGVTPEELVVQMIRALKEISEKNPELAALVECGGLTIPGFADPVTGDWVESDFLPVKDLPICKLLTKEFGIPFFADNDCNACALAERYFGGAKGLDDFLYMTVSTGIGGALYTNGVLHYGEFWHAGEIGMFVAEEDGRISDTGSMYGILEMHASGRGLAANYQEFGGQALIDGKVPGGPEISKLAREGDPVALKTLDAEGKYLGRAIANACAMADFKKIILGGGISLLFDLYEKPLLEEFSRIWPGREVAVEATQLGYSGAFLGAAAVGLRGLEGFGADALAEDSVLHVQVGWQVKGALEIKGKPMQKKDGDFGSFLVAKGLEDPGQSLNALAAGEDWGMLCVDSAEGKPEACEKLNDWGYALGKAVAATCILLDPGKVVLSGCVTENPCFKAGFLKAMTKETYYRGDFPFAIEYQTHP